MGTDDVVEVLNDGDELFLLDEIALVEHLLD
jgi:hypothetical protein